MKRDVSSRIVLTVTETADLVFAIAVSSLYRATESFTATLDGEPVDVSELPDAHGGRLHRIRSGPGELVVSYTASIDGEAAPLQTGETELLIYRRPSRYAESDSLAPTAAAEFSAAPDAASVLTSVAAWVGTQLAYVSGSSLPTDGAIRTLLNRQGVCRDYAHLCVALLRASGIPARVVAVYAPGLSPMDFHAVAEGWVDGAWRAVDATTLAPRSTLVRIATGRDASDTAFLNVLSGRADIASMQVGAVADVLPDDDLTRLVSLA
ncbi:transglutaminase domain-containing protein [Microbacterium saccharophilum]|uniref:Transglutaminase domain-containing protein n=1 Tax=Microbacterium saccharophilum TaxID=1213358 RepID=A0A5C8IB41_9MICO|nr:transglutaminase domain-containing protein [Microbacterium saccharophilum]TXK15562.1 transglutaminase domain-containing protein [Microbacterium saccharophilum]GEP47862.1 putative transglutaminase-like protein [Microbacterium saccharophilum]